MLRYKLTSIQEWSTVNTISVLEDYFSEGNTITTVFPKLSQSISRLTTNTFSKKKAKDVEYYYQFLCRYMHLHVNYKKLVISG